ncbi:MAG: hypothetical protein D6743_15230, partial [Calditrichaeota bacterium]
ILTLTEEEFEVRFPREKQIVADWTATGVHTAVTELLNDPDVDIVLAMGVLASADACNRGELPKPVIAPFVIDAGLQGFPKKDGASGVRNLHYLSLPSRLVGDIRAFREIVPFRKVTLLMNTEVVKQIPGFVERTREALQEMGLELRLVPVGRSIDPILDLLTGDVEAVYIGTLLQLSSDDFDRLVQTLTARKIPSFSLMGVREVRRGVLATLSPDFFPRITRRIALNFQKILLGEKPETIPVSFAVGKRLTINMATARRIGVSPPFSVLTEADVIDEERTEVSRRLDLRRVMAAAVAENLDLAAKRSEVAAGRQNINEARSAVLPHLGLSSLGLIVDKDRAEASFGNQAQRSLSGSLQFSQLLFSEPAWANVSIQKSLQRSRVAELERFRLDIAQRAATAYLQILRAKTFERVQKENLKRARSHLELARVREAIGYSRRSEVYRWESEIANDRKGVIRANANRNLAEIELNRLLHRPLEEAFLTQETDLNDPALLTSQQAFLVYFNDPLSFKTLREFMVQVGLKASPELHAFDSAIAAKERELRSATRRFWSPTVAVQAELTGLFAEGGAGTSGLQLPPSLPIAFPQPDNTNVNLGFRFSIPLFEGGSRFAVRTRASEELNELHASRAALAERIEQRIRSALHVAGASKAAIALSRDAADAAKKNLNLVTDAYSRGAVDILDLLDAQNAALTADLAAANAVFDFLIDLFEVERAVGRLYFFASDEERRAFLNALDEYFKKAGVRRPRQENAPPGEER